MYIFQDSHIKWLGKIPSHWLLIPNKYLFTKRQVKVGKRFKDFHLLSLTTNGVQKKSIEQTKGKVPLSYEGYQIVKPNDMIFCLFDLDRSAVFSGLSKYTGMITSAYNVVECQKRLLKPNFADYWFQHIFSQRYYKIYAQNVRYTITYDIFGSLKSPIPPLIEQEQMVKFLDWKLSQINALINIRKQEIAELHALKFAVVSDAVTHGLNHSVPVKFSGIHWLGNIPAHWQIKKLRQLLHPVSIKNRPNLPLLSVVRERGIILRDIHNKESNHNYIPDDLSKYKVVQKGQFVINKMKSWQGSYGISPYTGIVSPAYFVFDIDFNNLDYFHFAIRSKVYVNFFAQASDGIRVGQWDLQMDRMKEIPFIIPPEK